MGNGTVNTSQMSMLEYELMDKLGADGTSDREMQVAFLNEM